MRIRTLMPAVGSSNSIEMEGSLSSITNTLQVASFLGVNIAKVKTWSNTGTLLTVMLSGNYQIPNGQFFNNTSLTKFKDIGGIVGSCGINSFRNTLISEFLLPKLNTASNASIGYNTVVQNLELPTLVNYGSQTIRRNAAAKIIKLPNLEKVSEGSTISNEFEGLTSLELLDMKKLKIYGTPSNQNGATISGFANLKTGCVINVNIAIATANNGSVNTAFLYAKNSRAAIVNFYDDNGNYVSTL